MKTITFTEAELNQVRHALEMANDMNNDMLLDPLWVESGKCKTFSSDEMKALRKEVEANLNTLITLKSALAKVGGKTNEAGYSV